MSTSCFVFLRQCEDIDAIQSQAVCPTALWLWVNHWNTDLRNSVRTTPGRPSIDMDQERLARKPPRRLEQQQRLADRTHVVDADDLHPLPGQGQRHADRPARPIGFPVSEDLADEPLPRGA